MTRNPAGMCEITANAHFKSQIHAAGPHSAHDPAGA
jgi:hypothetical protein